MALIRRFQAWRKRVNCYKGRHNMEVEKQYATENFAFTQKRCKNCGTRKTGCYPLGD